MVYCPNAQIDVAKGSKLMKECPGLATGASLTSKELEMIFAKVCLLVVWLSVFSLSDFNALFYNVTRLKVLLMEALWIIHNSCSIYFTWLVSNISRSMHQP